MYFPKEGIQMANKLNITNDERNVNKNLNELSPVRITIIKKRQEIMCW